MSQLFGCVRFNSTVDVAGIAKHMQKSMSFFEGDAQGIYQSETVFICNKFLFNTPEAANTTSICQNERYVLAASCRIDNREELAVKLNIQEPLKASDHEYILAAYAHYQEACVKHLLGDFSFAVWDKQEQKLFVARDHLGVRPLFYTYQKDVFLFTSDLNAFLNLEFIDTNYKKSYVAGMLHGSYNLKYLGVHHTCYHAIYRVKPSHYLLVSDGHLQEKKYWELKPAFPKDDEVTEDVHQKFYHLFYESVKCRMRGIESFGVGLELSGGLDSSSIACMVNEVLAENNKLLDNLFSFSLVQSEEGRACALDRIDDEEHLQDLILDLLNIKKKNIYKLNKHPFDNYLNEIEDNICVNGGINIQYSTWQKTIYNAMQAVSCKIKLSGFAGDELVTDSGRLWMYDIWFTCRPARILKELLKFDRNIYKSLFWYLRDRVYGYKMNKKAIAKEIDSDFLDAKYLKNLPAKEYSISVRSYKHYLISRIMRPFTSLRFESENLNALRFNSECRYPMADIRLLEFMIQLPADFFKPEKVRRNFIRKALNGILPKPILARDDKTGAVIPYLRYKNKIFIEQLLKDGLPTDFEGNMVDTKKIADKLKTPENLKRETDVISLLMAVYLAKTVHQCHPHYLQYQHY